MAKIPGTNPGLTALDAVAPTLGPSLRGAGMEQLARHLLCIWHCRLSHVEVPCVIPLVRTGVQIKRGFFSQVLQLTNTGPRSEHWQGNSDTMLRTNHSTFLLPALTHPLRLQRAQHHENSSP